MAVFRVNKDKENPYMTVNKFFIHDSRLSLKAKGLMSYFLSRPDDWEFYVSEIKKHTTDRETSISNAIQELIKYGYIKRNSKRGEKGKFKGGYDYEVYETPLEFSEDLACTENSPKRGKPESGKSRTGKNPNRENPILLNKDLKLSNDLKLNKETTTNKSSGSRGNIEVFKYFEKCGFGLLSPIMLEKIASDIEMYSKEWVMKAAEVADGAGKHNYNYVKGILENWRTNGGMKNAKRGEKDGDNRKCVEELEAEGIGFTV